MPGGVFGPTSFMGKQVEPRRRLEWNTQTGDWQDIGPEAFNPGEVSKANVGKGAFKVLGRTPAVNGLQSWGANPMVPGGPSYQDLAVAGLSKQGPWNLG